MNGMHLCVDMTLGGRDMANQNSIFISYSSKDLKFVERITEELEKMGVVYWKAPEMIPAGSSYAREIPQAIQNCGVFLLVLSPTSQESIWVEKEIDSAICNRKTIIPFQVKEVELNDTFRFYLNNVQMISYADDPQKAFVDLKRQLCQWLPELNMDNPVVEKVTNSRQSDSSATLIKKNTANNRVRTEGRSGRHERSSNALRMNRIPIACQYCGCKELINEAVGIFRCERCGRENYDDFQTIRNYLEKAGATSAIVIEQATGVPRRIIEYFFREEYLEIPKNSPIRLSCERCGAPIRTGTLCDDCKAGLTQKSKNDRHGSWHTFL